VGFLGNVLLFHMLGSGHDLTGEGGSYVFQEVFQSLSPRGPS
jgi:hypothetical protein